MREKEENVLQKVDLCAKYLIVQMIEANAETLSYDVDGFHKGDIQYGDFVVTVTKKAEEGKGL